MARSARSKLRNALAVVTGVEPVISLRDVCGLDPKAVEETLVATATAIVQQYLATG